MCSSTGVVLPRHTARVVCPHLVLPRIAADGTRLGPGVQAPGLQPRPGPGDFLGRADLDAQVVDGAAGPIARTVQHQIERRVVDCEVGIAWPQLGRRPVPGVPHGLAVAPRSGSASTWQPDGQGLLLASSPGPAYASPRSGLLPHICATEVARASLRLDGSGIGLCGEPKQRPGPASQAPREAGSPFPVQDGALPPGRALLFSAGEPFLVQLVCELVHGPHSGDFPSSRPRGLLPVPASRVAELSRKHHVARPRETHGLPTARRA